MLNVRNDYPGGLESATLLAGPSNSVMGNIEVDVDRDWFCFKSYPGATYQFEFDTNTIWDVDVTIHAPDGSTMILATNTINQVPAQWGWTNNGAFGQYYIELGGLVEFTTGTYSMVMLRSGFVDSDNDDLEDGWETDNFGDLDEDGSGDDDGDGFTDEEEFFMVTQATNAASGLFVIDVQNASGFSQVSWPSAENGSYRLSRSEELNGVQIWTEIQTLYETNAVGMSTLLDILPVTSEPHRYYRIEFLY